MIHNISYRVFVYGTESEEKVREAIKTLFPSSLPKKDVTKGYYKNPVLILFDKIDKKRDMNTFIQNLNQMKVNEKKKILDELENRIDDKCNLFLRFNKQEACLGNLVVVEHGDAIHLKIKMAAYPAKKEIAMKLANELFR